MCEIDITDFVRNAEPFEFSASQAERGKNAGPETWNNALAEGMRAPLLTEPAHFAAMKQWMKETGAWDSKERAAYTHAMLNALFIQLVSGDMRECGLNDPDEFDWDEYENDDQSHGRIFKATNDRIYFSLD